MIVRDNGALVDGGVDTALTAVPFVITVRPVNDAPFPTLLGNQVAYEDDPLQTVTGFATLVPDASLPRDASESVQVASVYTVTNNNNGLFSVQPSINPTTGTLTYTPTPNTNGIATVTVIVQDNGGIDDFGVDTSTSVTFTIQILPINDPPVGTDKTLTVLEDMLLDFTAADFGFSDPIDAAAPSGANAFLAVKITELPAKGTLLLGAVPVVTGQFIPVTSLSNFKYRPALNENSLSGQSYTSFKFQVQDDGGVFRTGIDLDQSPNVITINVTSVNDVPAGANKLITTLEDTAYTFTAADFGFTDVSDIPSATGANSLLNVKITNLPAKGILELAGSPVAVGAFIPAAAIGTLVYRPVLNANGAAFTSFTFQVQDDGTTVDGGVDLDQTPNTITINVTSVNDAPAGTNKTVTTLEDTTYTFTSADFGFTDPFDLPVNTFLSLTISSLPASGTLRLAGVAVTAGQVFAPSAISTLTFSPVLNENGPTYTSFMFKVRDDGTTANFGVDLDQSPNVITVKVDPVNDKPLLALPTPTSRTLQEDAVALYSTALGNAVAVTDVDDLGGIMKLTITSTTATIALSSGTGLTVTGSGTATLVASGTKANLNAALDGLAVTPNANYFGTTTVVLKIEDNGNSGSGGNKFDQQSLTINYLSQNDAPTVTVQQSPLIANEDLFVVLNTANANVITINDVDLASGSLRVTLTVTQGTVTINRVAGISFPDGIGDGTNDVTMTFIAASISSLNLALNGMIYRPNPGVNGSDTLTVTVNDQGNTGAGGPKETTRVIPITINAVNDAPTLIVPGTQTTLEDTAKVFSTGTANAISVADIDVGIAGLVQVALVSTNGTLTLGSTSGVTFDNGTTNGNASVTFRGLVADVNAALNGLSYLPNLNFSGSASLSIVVNDLGNVGSGGAKSATGNVAISVSAVNDAPINSVPSGGLSTSEDITLTISGASAISIADVDVGLASEQVTLSVTNGRLTLGTTTGLAVTGNSTSTVTVTGSISLLNSSLATLSFVPTSNFNGSAVLTVTTNDLGNTGGAARTDVDTVNITINPVNDAPVGVAESYSILRSGTLSATDSDGTADANAAPARTNRMGNETTA